MSIRKAEQDLWGEIIKEVDMENSKNVQKAINKLKEECKKVYSQNDEKVKSK